MQLFQEKYWAIDYGFAKRIEPLLTGGRIDMLQIFPKPEPTILKFKPEDYVALTESEAYMLMRLRCEIVGNVMVLPVFGATTANGAECTLAYSDIEQVINIVNAEPNLSGLVLRMNTPGGGIVGMARMANIIKASKKPIACSVQGLCASAGAYMSAYTDAIVVEDANATTLGSIGVMNIVVDQSKAIENAGIKVYINRGPKSSNKNPMNGMEPITPAMLAEAISVMGKIEGDFHKVMKAGRPRLDASIFTDEAKTYTGTQAIKLGLADTLGTLEDTVAFVASMDGKRKKYSAGYGF